METITNNDRRWISAAAGEVMIPITEMVMDIIESVQALTREQHNLILTDAGIELPHGLLDEDVVMPAMSLVQNEWYRATSADGSIPPRVVNNHAERMDKLKSRIEALRLNPPAPEPVKPVKVPKEPKSPREPKPPKEPKPAKAPGKIFAYELLADAIKASKSLAPYLEMTQVPTGHDGIIVQELERVGAPMTLAELVPEIEATKRYETNDPIAKSVKWHVNKLVEKGYIKVTEVEGGS